MVTGSRYVPGTVLDARITRQCYFWEATVLVDTLGGTAEPQGTGVSHSPTSHRKCLQAGLLQLSLCSVVQSNTQVNTEASLRLARGKKIFLLQYVSEHQVAVALGWFQKAVLSQQWTYNKFCHRDSMTPPKCPDPPVKRHTRFTLGSDDYISVMHQKQGTWTKGDVPLFHMGKC